ncbi:MAG: hypothetical protein JXR91_17475, partial [Deltaproteobacteria bacterium]|nr:hypothetical protein [Deltaproteobacteria bacterium]
PGKVQKETPKKSSSSKTAKAPAVSKAPIVKKVKIMASYDWSMRSALSAFARFYDRPLKYKRKQYVMELGRIIAEPQVCGDNLKKDVDFVVDRTTHWNAYYKMWAQQALNSMVQSANHPNTFENHDKHHTYDLMARAIHPDDHFPKTVLLPQYAPYTAEQKQQEMWEYYQSLIINNTKYGWDPHRRETDWNKVNESYERAQKFKEKNDLMRDQFYCKGNYIQEVMEKHFNNQYPVWLKKAFGGGGSDVFKIKSLDELYKKYDETGGKPFHIQESVENYDIFIRCMAIGPQILPMKFQPDEPLHEHYSPEKITVDKDVYTRMEAYVMLINAYHRWTYNSFECIIKDNVINPIDFANACPDSNFTSLHAHFPWLIKSLYKWFAFCAVTEKDMRVDMEQVKYLKVLNDPKISQKKKFDHHYKLSKDYFEIDEFNKFCAENFADIDSSITDFYKQNEESILDTAIRFSDFPENEHDKFYRHYKDIMDNTFNRDPQSYLTDVIFS